MSDEYWMRVLKEEAEDIVASAASHGVVITIAQVPLLPLAMGNYKSVVSVRSVKEEPVVVVEHKPLTHCASGQDGDCIHPDCPQLRDGEPVKSGRHCPIDTREEGD